MEKEAGSNDSLNGPSSHLEFVKALKSLKNKKAAGPDMICNEMVKLAGPKFHSLLVSLYNKLFVSQTYPDLWKTSMITTIFKSGDVNIPGNYRGVAVANSMHKLFTIILNNRICINTS